VSVVILTLNEEINVRECLASCAWSDDVHVLDSGSTDRTAEIVRSLGAGFWHNPFRSFGEQRNWAIENIPMRHEWVFHLDADERFTPELAHAMGELLKSNPTEAGFHIPQKLMFMGRWLRRSAAYPNYQMRLFHTRRMRFCDYGHGQRELTDGVVGTLKVPYLHYGFAKGLHDWFDKHNRYSSLEALQFTNRHPSEGSGVRLGDLFASDRVTRRRAWKDFGYRLPFRAQLRWFVTLFVLGGILEGRAGMTYASLISTYERMTSLKLRLLQQQQRDARRGVASRSEETTFAVGGPLPLPERSERPSEGGGRGLPAGSTEALAPGSPAGHDGLYAVGGPTKEGDLPGAHGDVLRVRTEASP
jgi:hypothetical protein